MGLLDDIFGTGKDPRWDDSNYTAPVYGTDSNGNEVTASFGKGDRGCYTGDNDDSESQSSGLLGLF